MILNLKERVIIKASSLFIRCGIKSVTMDYIAGQLGISKRTLYENFKDKDELLLECLKYIDTKNREELTRIMIGCSNSMEVLLFSYKHALELMRRTNRNYYTDLKRYHPQVAVIFEQYKKDDQLFFVEWLELGKKEGYIRSNLKSEIVMLLLGAQIEMLMNSIVFDTSNFSFMEVFENIVVNFTRGISTPKGVAFIDEFVETQLKKE